VLKTPTDTLEADPATLTAKKFDLGFDIDPLFHKTSASFDEGGAVGMLVNNLCVGAGCALVFDSSSYAPGRHGAGEAEYDAR
jgi:condensin complex subunit 2